MGKTQNLGIVSPVPMGDWIAQDSGNNYVTYQKLNMVRHNNAAYIAIQANSNIEPGVASNWQTYWMLLNSDGEQGPVGPQGPAVDVLQETGNSETAAMSQKAVTTELNNLETEINTNASNIEANNKQITINANNIKALFNLQLEKNVLAYDNAELAEEIQKTGGSELAGLTILDGSYATVNKISGNTVAYEQTLKNAQISGIKSIGKNLYNNYGVSTSDTALELTNSYGSTISTNNANDEVVVTQIPNSSYGGSAYQNGFIFYFYTTPIQEIYDSVTVSFDLEITANPLEVNTMLVLSTYYENANSVSVDGTLLNKKQRVSYTTTKKSSPSPVKFAPNFEIRCGGMSFKISNFQVCASTASLPTVFMPYTEITMQLPQTFELGKWDYITFNEDTNIATITRRTSIEAFNEQDYNEAENTYQGSTDFVLSADKTLVARIDETLTDETFVFDSNKYLVGDKGIEQILTPTDTDGMTCFDYGANTTEENSYYVIVGDNV